jgi:hypothetical protein
VAAVRFHIVVRRNQRKAAVTKAPSVVLQVATGLVIMGAIASSACWKSAPARVLPQNSDFPIAVDEAQRYIPGAKFPATLAGRVNVRPSDVTISTDGAGKVLELHARYVVNDGDGVRLLLFVISSGTVLTPETTDHLSVEGVDITFFPDPAFNNTQQLATMAAYWSQSGNAYSAIYSAGFRSHPGSPVSLDELRAELTAVVASTITGQPSR